MRRWTPQQGGTALVPRVAGWRKPGFPGICHPAAREPDAPLSVLPGRVGSIGGRPLGEPSVSLTCAPPLSPPHWPFAGANGGRRGEAHLVRICSGELPGLPFPWGKRRARESMKTRELGEWGVPQGLYRGPGRHPFPRLRPGPRGPPDANGLVGLTRLPSGSLDSKEVGVRHFHAYPRV